LQTAPRVGYNARGCLQERIDLSTHCMGY